jgi:predicted neuraminidase
MMLKPIDVARRAVGLLVVGVLTGAGARAEEPGVLAAEFLFETAPFPSCHASTIAETPGGLVASWFGGTREGDKDVGIWFARQEKDRWTPPVEVADGRQDDGTRYPCWNPVLFQDPSPGGRLLLFYKVGPRPSSWWGLLMTSADGGHSWSKPARLPEGILGPIKDKPVLLADGALLCPSSTEDQGWRIHLERTTDLGRTWTRTGPLNDGKTFAAIQPAILFHSGRVLQLVCRSRQGKIVATFSPDGGASWGPLEATTLPNPNSGIDAVSLRDGRALLVYNHTPKGRSPLNVAVSADGRTWKAGPVLESEPGEYSYPAVIQASDGLVHVTYTWKRQRIKHVVIDPAKLVEHDLP